MKWLLSAYSQGWNRAHMRRGHVFQGRYKAVPVNASDSDTHYFKALVDYGRPDSKMTKLIKNIEGMLIRVL